MGETPQKGITNDTVPAGMQVPTEARQTATRSSKQLSRMARVDYKHSRRSRAEDRDRGRMAREFWQIPRSGWKEIAVRTWNESNDDNISLLAAGVAFYNFLAFVPLLASVVLLYGIIGNPANVAGQMAALMRILPEDAARIVNAQLTSLTAAPVARTTFGLIFAILLALYGAMRGATSIIGALNVTYGERETRSIVRTTLLSLAFTVGAVVVAIIASIAIGAMGLIGSVIHLPKAAGPLITTGLWAGTALVASVVIAVVYRYGPDRTNARWTWLTPGAAFASVGALLASFLFGLYVSHFAGYNATYGALGAVVSFLMWLYVTAFVVLLGAELNAEIEHQTARDTTAGPEKPQGERGAQMADTTAGAPVDDATNNANLAAAATPADTTPGTIAPLLSGFMAARLVRTLGDVRVGTVSMTLLSAGIAMAGRKGKTSASLLCLGAAAGLIWRSRTTGDSGGRIGKRRRS